ncbi:DUF1330 domain-containing protein [Janibacter limosus]|uniref:DUF1330 domain-containing protein n=1 Tax=Janibacter limosus TaxID=53458 RepID=UPI000A02715D|nr:DUF1330 domain-containing protein [Janibacter limosus]
MTTSPVHVVFEVDVLDPDSSAYREYKLAVAPLIERFGGRYLARAARGTAIEGPATQGVWHLVEFPDPASVHAFWACPEYARLRPLREGAADVRAVIIEPQAS